MQSKTVRLGKLRTAEYSQPVGIATINMPFDVSSLQHYLHVTETVTATGAYLPVITGSNK